MKSFKLLSLLLVVILLLNIPFVCLASAENFVDKTEFELKVSSVDAEQNPGNVLVQVYCTTDPSKLITTFGATLVANINYIDLVSKSGEVITDSYKQDASTLGSDFALSASKIGAKKQVFGGMKGLSVASYNSTTKNMYIFICGMTISGIKINGKTELAKFYIKTKNDKVPSSAIRVMDSSETGAACPSKAVYSAEISSTTEAGSVVKDIKLDVDSSLIDNSAPEETTTEKQAETTSEKTDTSSTSASEKTTSSASDNSGKSVEDLTDEQIDKMSEAQVEKAIKSIVESDKKLNLPEKVKSSKAYKDYEKALENAEKVLADKNSTKKQKAEALKELVKAKRELEKEFPEVLGNSSESSKSGISPVIYIAAGVAVAAIVIVLIIIIKKRKK